MQVYDETNNEVYACFQLCMAPPLNRRWSRQDMLSAVLQDVAGGLYTQNMSKLLVFGCQLSYIRSWEVSPNAQEHSCTNMFGLYSRWSAATPRLA